MRLYCLDRGLPLIQPGKLLVPVRAEDAAQLNRLEERGAANGVEVRRLGRGELSRLEPDAGSATGEALFVPTTAVVDPARIVASLAKEAVETGIELRFGGRLGTVDPERSELEWNGERLTYGQVVNAAGLHADRVAHLFGTGKRYRVLPFKGLYWRLDPASRLRPRRLIYPVPDLRVPFLGVHTTTAVNGNVYIGPTALPALGRENYGGVKGVEITEAAAIMVQLARMAASGREGFRRLAVQEGLRYLKPRFTAAARHLLPRLKPSDLLPCDKVGIRAQLFDRQEGVLVNDFLVCGGSNSIHVLNAVSPAFTSAFPLARHVCESELRL